MPGAQFSYALLTALATALLVAAFTDLRRREIDNWLTAAIALAAPMWWLATGLGWPDMLTQIGMAAAAFAVACLMFAIRQMGGGDVKLLAALALWFPPLSFLQLIVLMAVIGGGASVAMAACNMKHVPGERLLDALALSVALAWIALAGAVARAAATHQPLFEQRMLEAIGAMLPGGWMLAVIILATMLIVTLGFHHIVRRQKSRLPIPYGIAIAAAGLWVLGDETLSSIIHSAPAG